MLRKILDVPKIKQSDGYCLPASLAMVLNYYGVQVTQEEVALGLQPRGRGFGDKTVLPYARSKGMVAHKSQHLAIGNLVQLIDREIPVMVRTKCLSNLDRAHVSVIRGYDLITDELFFNDPCDLRRSKIPFRIFEGIWEVDNDQGYSKNMAISIRLRCVK